MKKAMKKLMAALLAVAMVCAMAIPAFAAGEDATAGATTGEGKITIDNVITGQTYTIYRILDLEYHAATNAYRYTANEAWKDFIRNQTGYLKLDENTGVVTWINDNNNNNGTAIQKFANDAGTYAKDHDVQAVKSIKAEGKMGEHSTADNSTSITFENLPLGWYLVVSNLNKGALCSIDTTDPNVVIKEKNSDSTFDKHILEGTEFKTANNAGIGDVVNFQIDIVVNDGQPKGYVVHDKMSEGLNFNSSTVKVFLLRHSSPDDSGLLTTGYTLVTNPDDSCTFEVKFDDGTLKPNDAVTISYTATVNNKAVIAGSGNTNEAHLQYNDKTTVTHTTTTYVWGMGVRKFANLGTGKEDTPLAEAEFQLYKKDGETQKYAMFIETGVNTSIYKLTGWTTNKADAIKVKTPANGNIKFEGLDAGTYYLEETTAPTGYNKLTAPITVVIESTLPTKGGAASYTVKANNVEAPDYIVRVENKAGTELPSTGGIGTTIFYVVGGGLMAAAAILLITKKRMENH